MCFFHGNYEKVVEIDHFSDKDFFHTFFTENNSNVSFNYRQSIYFQEKIRKSYFLGMCLSDDHFRTAILIILAIFDDSLSFLMKKNTSEIPILWQGLREKHRKHMKNYGK